MATKFLWLYIYYFNETPLCLDQNVPEAWFVALAAETSGNFLIKVGVMHQ